MEQDLRISNSSSWKLLKCWFTFFLFGWYNNSAELNVRINRVNYDNYLIIGFLRVHNSIGERKYAGIFITVFQPGHSYPFTHRYVQCWVLKIWFYLGVESITYFRDVIVKEIIPIVPRNEQGVELRIRVICRKRKIMEAIME